MAGFQNGGSGTAPIEYSVFYAADPKYATAGSIGAGSTVADTTAMTNAAAAAVAAGAGIVLFPSGTFQISTWPVFTSPGTQLRWALRGEGSMATIFKSYATSLATSLTVQATDNSTEGAPEWGGFTIDGTNATGTAVGLSWGDVSQATLNDITILNFTGASQYGTLFYNRYGWTEDITIINMVLQNNTVAMDFQVGVSAYPSFDYWHVLGLKLVLQPNQHGIVDEIGLGSLGGAGQVQHIGSMWRVVINAFTAATNTGILHWQKGYSKWEQVLWNIVGETDGGGATAHQSFRIDNGSPYPSGFGTIYLGGTWQSPTLSYTSQLSDLCMGYVAISGYLNNPTAGVLNVNTKGINRQTNALPTNPTLTSGTQSQNTSGHDQLWTIPITSSGLMTAKLTLQYYTISVAPTTLVAGCPLTGTTIPITVLVPNGTYIRIDLVNGSFGTITAVAA